MYLDILENGHRRRTKFALRVMQLVAGIEPDDVIKTSLYRPPLFGRAWIRLLRQVMRGPSAWTPGERELIAAFASHRNACPYCVGIHTGTATLGMHADITAELFDEWRSGGFAPRIMAIFDVIEKVCAEPANFDNAALTAAHDQGVSTNAVRDALLVVFVFDVVNRLANALGFEVLAEGERIKTAAVLHRIGYRLPGFLLR